MKRLAGYLVSFWGEILLLLFLLFLSNNHLQKKDVVIQADGRGYYEYLPAAFIYHDLQFGYLDTLETEFYDDALTKGDFYKRLENGKRFDKYFVGTAVLQMPFFLAGHAWAGLSGQVQDGFSKPYQVSIFAAALCYLFFGAVFLRLVLITYNVNRFWIFAAQAGVLVCSSLMQYVHGDAAYSHVYSFFLISGFVYFARNFILGNSPKMLFWTIIFLGLIFLVRPVNVLVILLIPMLCENYKQLIYSLKSVFTTNVNTTIFSVLISFLIYQIQCLVWYMQTGHWFYYSYGEETFNWSDPMFADFLFSYRKGFFLWAPWFFVLLACATLFHAFRRRWFRLLAFWIAFCLLTYVLSSWWSWTYGGSFGSRPMIDFYPALIVFAAPLLARGSGILKWIVLLAIPVLGYVAVIQTYQYQRMILLYDGMDEESYWKVFLQTDYEYDLYLWGSEIETGAMVSETSWVKHQAIPAERWYVSDTLDIELPAGKMPTVGQITFRSRQKRNNESLEVRLLDPNDSLIYNHYSYMLHEVDEAKGEQYIDYRFQIPAELPPRLKTVFLVNTKERPVTIDSMKIRFFTD